MILGALALSAVLEMVSQQSPASAAERPCLTAQDPAVEQMCLGDAAFGRADRATVATAQRSDELNSAAERYKSAVRLATTSVTKIDALKRLVIAYDNRHLHAFAQLESALQEWIRLAPNDLSPLYRLAQAQEEDGLVEVAEQTLLDVRHQHPDAVEPNSRLMQFYARRVAVMREEKDDRQDNLAFNERDGNGVYRIGGSIEKPRQLNLGLDQPELVSDTSGQVVAEVTVDETGSVRSAKVIRSDSALLDEAALQAVRNWRFQPSVVNGQAVAVKMDVTVTFVPPQGQQQ